jgi:hypothetical protein
MPTATDAFVETTAPPAPLTSAVENPSTLGPKTNDALKATAAMLKKPVLLGESAYDTVGELRDKYTKEQKAAAAAEAARILPVRLIRAIGRRVRLIQKPL